MKIIPRDKYLQRIIELNGTPDIKIITGIRRSGKSKLMQAYIEYLKSHVDNCNIIYIDFMDLAFEEIKEYHALHAYVEAQYQANKTNYLFVDEVQMCPQFELAINSLYAKEKYDIYLTGSNAFLLSADLATLFTGRYIEIHVFPFSFSEYCRYYEETKDIDQLFEDYTIKGGLAGSYAYKTEKDRINYIKEVYETIVTRDLVQKYALPDTLVLQRLSEFLDVIDSVFLRFVRIGPGQTALYGVILKQLESISDICAMPLSFTTLSAMTSGVENIWKARKSFICVIQVSVMPFWEAEIWITAGCMKTWSALNFCAVGMMCMSESCTRKKSTSLYKRVTKKSIFR